MTSGPREGDFTMPPSSMAGVPMSSVIARIEKQLREMWLSSAKPGESARSRVCTMNLVVVADSRELAERYTAIVDEVTSSIPARAIVVALEPDAPSAALEGEATAVSATAPEGGGGLSSERVTLVARGSTCARVGSAVEALCMPEMPTTVVWLGRVYVDDPVFLSIATEAERVVLDTEFTSLSSLLKLAAWARADPARPKVADLAWTRLSIWQELCARFFDAPNMRDHAFGISKLFLRQASEHGARLGPEGSLFLGWLATRLSWRIQRMGGALRFRRPDGGLVGLSLGAVPRPKEVAPTALAYIAMDAEAGGVPAKGSIERDLVSGLAGQTADADVLSWRLDVDLPSATEQRVRLHVNKEAALLVSTLHRPVNDLALMESIAFAEQLTEDGLLCT